MTWRLALVDPAGAFPLRAFDVQPELTARPEVAFDLAVPASETLGICDRRPQILDVGVVPVFDPRDSFAVHCAQAAKDVTHGLLLRSRFPRATSVCSASKRCSHLAGYGRSHSSTSASLSARRP